MLCSRVVVVLVVKGLAEKSGSSLAEIFVAMGQIANLLGADEAGQEIQPIVGAETGGVLIPYINDIETALRGNRDSHKFICGVGCNITHHGTNDILIEDVGCILATNAEAIGATADIEFILPQGWGRVTHEEEEPVEERLITNCINEGPELGPRGNRGDAFICGGSPAILLGRVIPERPGS